MYSFRKTKLILAAVLTASLTSCTDSQSEGTVTTAAETTATAAETD